MEILNSIQTFYLANEKTILLVMMPITYAFVGWMTNVVALKMTFFPIKFFGIPPYLGWQGIIPRKSHKMAGKAVDVITEKLIDIKELAEQIDPKQLENELNPLVKRVTKELLQDVVDDINPTLWKLLPDSVKKDILTSVEKDSSSVISKIYYTIKANVYELFDIKGMVVKSLTGDNVKLIVDMFQEVGQHEFKFIERSGLYFGSILGLIQLGIFMLLTSFQINANWTLPIQGIIVGYLTNFLALKMIFRPLRRQKIAGLFYYQGIFLKRQNEVSDKYSKMVATKILTPKKILEEIFFGKAADEVLQMIRKHVVTAIEKAVGMSKPIVAFAVGEQNYEVMKTYVIAQLINVIPETTESIEKYFGKAMDLENLMSQRLKELPPEEFEGILRPAFQEDEWLLILIGSILGGMVGSFQMFLM